ncbi:MAG: hypothetical protein AB1468_03055 [Candidatus Micrarchaeota archaeon]
MEIPGHASIRTTIDTYGMPSIEDISQEYEKLRKAYGRMAVNLFFSAE